MCGIIGVIGSPLASQEVYQGLLLLQHRGQDSAGILSYDFQDKSFNQFKDLGHVANVFSEKILLNLKGEMAIGHTRYSTVGSSEQKDIQPLSVGYPFGLGLVHNGNLVNFYHLKSFLRDDSKRHIFSENDLEAILNLMAESLSTHSKERFQHTYVEDAVRKVFEGAIGGYSVLTTIAGEGLVAFRDPHGIRPLIWWKKKSKDGKEIHCFASESNTLNFLGYEIVRDIKPGEMVYITYEGEVFEKQLVQEKAAPCMFEWIYFATPESTLEERNVYQARLQMGYELGEIVKELIDKNDISPDIIVPVPETSRVSAIALSEKVGIPYRELLIKNRYIQRSFILNTQESRARAVQLKLTPVASEIEGKKVLLVDDSIVRGTTSKRIIEMVRDAGAKEVYIASACPPIRHPCFYGIDFPNPEELVAYNRNEEEIAKNQKADKVIYMTIEGLEKSIGRKELCKACLTGDYPTNVEWGDDFKNKRENVRNPKYD